MFRNKRAQEVRPIADAQALLEDIARASVTKHDAIGLGTDVRFDGSRLNGGALVHEKRLVHLCVFRSAAEGNGGGSWPHRWDSLLLRCWRC